MRIGFIPGNDNPVRDDAAQSDASDELLALQFAEELHAARRDAYQALFRQEFKCASQLELIDPDHHDADQEMAEVVVRVGSVAEHDRLDALMAEARRLKRAVVEAEQRRTTPKRSARLMQHVTNVFFRLSRDGLLAASRGTRRA
jgi:hypothetical protein